MWGRFLKRKRNDWGLKSYKEYYREYERARRENPEKFEQEQETVRQWVLRVVKRRQQQSTKDEKRAAKSAHTIENTSAEAMEQMREIARAAFMKHPAATEADFRVCWPAIRAEMLKQYTLEELAAQPEGMSALLLNSTNSQAELLHQPLALNDSDDTRALLQAVRDGNIHDVNVLLLSGVDVNAIVDGWTALMVATIKGHGEIARALLHRRADANIKNNEGLTALRFAVAMADIDMMQLLLSKGADVNTVDNRWWTPIMQAADENNIECLKILLARGADLNISNEDGDTALALAERKRHEVIVYLLKRAGAA